MKKTFWLLAVIAALTIGNTGRTSAKCYTPDSEGDSIRIPKDSLAIMTVEELNAYYDSIYRLDHPRMQIIWNPDTSKAVNQPLRQKKEFSYSNSYVPNSVTLDTSNAVVESEKRNTLNNAPLLK